MEPHLQFDSGRCKYVSLEYCSSAKTQFAERKRRYFIYALIDPRDGMPFYIGKTYNPAQRFQYHDYLTRRPDQAMGSAIAIAERFQDIMASNVAPIMRLLRRTTLENGAFAEACTIRKFRKLNPNLLNRMLNEQEIKSRSSARKHKDGTESGSITP